MTDKPQATRPTCDGHGHATWYEEGDVTCPDCAGSGKAADSITVNETQPLTLEKAQRRYDAATAELDRLCQGPRPGFRMRIPAQRDDSDLVLGDALQALKALIDDRAELVEALETAAISLASIAVYETKHSDPDFMPALTAGNPADARELERAFRVLARVRGGQEK